MTKRDQRPNTLGQIRNPLVFFSLALLVIEAIIGTVVATSKMTGGYTFAAICVMAGLFLVVVIAVTVITVKWPQHLYEDIVKDVQSANRIAQLLTNRAFRDGVEDMVDEIIQTRSGQQSSPESGKPGDS